MLIRMSIDRGVCLWRTVCFLRETVDVSAGQMLQWTCGEVIRKDERDAFGIQRMGGSLSADH